MDSFDFHFHSVSVQYPESGTRIQLGKSYTYAVEDSAPDQRVLTLDFAGMYYYFNTSGVLDATINPSLNFFALERFYLKHKLFMSFNYTHPVYGVMVVKFNKPLKTPKGAQDTDNGLVEGFSLEFLEIP